MQMNEVVFQDAKPVDGYGPGFFRIGGTVIQGPLVAGPTGTQTWGGFDDVAALLALVGQIDVLFIGTGPEVAHLPETLRTQLEEAGLAVEIMSSPAACRTYNVLLSEGRRIAMALIPV